METFLTLLFCGFALILLFSRKAQDVFLMGCGVLFFALVAWAIVAYAVSEIF
jgi:hypothetical protein